MNYGKVFKNVLVAFVLFIIEEWPMSHLKGDMLLVALLFCLRLCVRLGVVLNSRS